MLTIGFELEISGVPVTFRKPAVIKTSIDASIEREYRVSINNRRPSTFRTGIEINSPVFYNLNDAFDYIDYIYNTLVRRGFFYSAQTSFQIHIGLQLSELRLYKLIKAFKDTEYKWLTLGGLGDANRGIYNDFIYERPLSKPLVVRTTLSDSGESLYVKAHNIDHILSYARKSIRLKNRVLSILYLFGDSSRIRLKYNMSRYSVVNFISLLQRNTIEVRVFNTPRSSIIAKRVVLFTYKFVEKVINNKINKDYNNLFDYLLSNARLDTLYNRSEPIKDYMVKEGTIFHRYDRGFNDGNYWANYSYKELKRMGLVYEGIVHSPRQTDLREHKYRINIY